MQSFSLGRPTYPDDAVFHTTEHHFFDPNIWPERPAGMREALEKWYGAVNRLSDHVLSQVALALDLEEGFFVDKVDHSVDTLRFNLSSNDRGEGSFVLFHRGDVFGDRRLCFHLYKQVVSRRCGVQYR